MPISTTPITAAAVVVYFRRHRVDTRTWHTLVAPGLGLAGLAALLVMTAYNLPLLVGGSTTAAAVIGVVLVGTFAGGAVVAVMRPHAGRHSPSIDTPTIDPPSIDKETTR